MAKSLLFHILITRCCFINTKISVIGGDLRQIIAARILSEYYETAVCGFEKSDKCSDRITKCKKISDCVQNSSAIILPLPYTRDKINIFAPFSEKELLCDELLSCASDKALLLGGMLDSTVMNRHKNSIDYYEQDELQIKNAIPTAEAAIAIAIDETPCTLFGSQVCVLGYGRIGRILSHKLRCLGAEVTVCARNKVDLSYAEAFGCIAVDMCNMENALENKAVIFNTVPARIIVEEYFKKIGTDTVIIDLASKPGGIDFEIAKQKGLKVIWALSLPGKTAPVTAGRIIADTIIGILHQGGIF